MIDRILIFSQKSHLLLGWTVATDDESMHFFRVLSDLCYSSTPLDEFAENCMYR
jgi:hypothetical protein